ncbi:MAG: Nramp family divalent metal transporter [Kangiellaceae bacterium]|nr:Nramp family divalent metal transporter [Kangiellaceae bacterium]
MRTLKFGPGILVTAAFIGPGTVITASIAGANFGFSLLWALLFSVIATFILQEMAGRLGLVTQQGLGENIRANLSHPVVKAVGLSLVVSAIVIGNAAYQGGNIAGASAGVRSIFGDVGFSGFWPMIIGLSAFILLWTGKYKLIEKTLVALVGLMSLAFITTFFITQPKLADIFSGLFIPSLPDGATLTVIALIGTTVVPYNLFLYSSSVSKKWSHVEQLNEVKNDLYVSVSLGGLISVAILSTMATAFFGKQPSFSSTADLAPALEPLFGNYAEIFMAMGLFSAGISSAITAPLAAAFALSGVLNLNKDLSSWPFKLAWLSVLLVGMYSAVSGFKPITIIWFAQVANGILLPLVTVFLIWIMNTRSLGKYKNNKMQNALGFLVLLVTLMLSGRSLMLAFGIL